MRDQGLDEAIRAAGGITELARRIGISQPSVSNWDRVPAERVLSVESATGITRSVLRPDAEQCEIRCGDLEHRAVVRIARRHFHDYPIVETSKRNDARDERGDRKRHQVNNRTFWRR